MSAVLTRSTLVLNRSWLAISTTSVRHALALLFKGSAQAIHTETYEVHGFESWAAQAVGAGESFVRTVRSAVRVPEVIVLTGYDGVPARRHGFSRRGLLRRDDWTCQYCGARGGDLTVDHVLPRSRGGGSTWENCVVACSGCNRRKGDRLPAEARMALRKHPAPPQPKQLWSAEGGTPPSWRTFLTRR